MSEAFPIGRLAAVTGLPVERLRAAGTPELPDDPTPEQLDAWLELAELAALRHHAAPGVPA